MLESLCHRREARHPHNKIIIDRNVIITGSFNFTRAAEEKNAENLLVLRGISRWWSGI
jgi:phosphatidylserine/phosphatidylglycerophosphate/cardiolipin synthase-like enzyme